jgi:hypothetical protein
VHHQTPEWEQSSAAALADRMTIRFIDQEPFAESLGEILERYGRRSDPDLWMVGHLWFLIGTGDLTVSSTPAEARRILMGRRCERVAVRRRVAGGRKPIPTRELLTWMEGDWLGLWELADQGGLDAVVPLEDVRDFVIGSVEPGLRTGVIRLGRVYGSPDGMFEPMTLPLHEQLELIRQGVRTDKIPLDIDLWFDSVPREATD